jgi:ribonucleoside-diphosphate reductase alpha subunit
MKSQNKNNSMKVIKRDGKFESISFDKIKDRIFKLLTKDERKQVDSVEVAQKVIQGLVDNIKTTDLDELTGQILATRVSSNYIYGSIAARICVSNLHKNLKYYGVEKFSDSINKLYKNTDRNGENSPLISDEVYNVIKEHSSEFDKLVSLDRDYNYDYFGFKTLEKSYLMKVNKVIVESPQYMIMRVSVGIHSDTFIKKINELDSSLRTDKIDKEHYDYEVETLFTQMIECVSETYENMSNGYFTHATPTLFNSGTPRPQNSSCFLLGTEDSIDGIYETIKNCAKISKWAGGIGVHLSNIRAKGSLIRKTNGESDGLSKLIKVYNDTARYVNQGGKRNGSFAIYIEPWHADTLQFLEMKKSTGDENERARDLFYALWIPDLFMERVESDSVWSFMCPDECKGLPEAYGDDFKKLYEGYEAKGKYRSQISARKLFNEIINMQVETGTPYMLYKDHINHKSNQKNIGTIKSSNLCAEIVEYSDSNEYAVCNLASIALPKFVVTVRNKSHFDFERLDKVTRIITRNLNKVIDYNFYPCPETKRSNLRHRPIAIGVQGLADAFALLKFPFVSKNSKELNIQIFECMYFATMSESCELSKNSEPYETFKGSPLSEGLFQFNLWSEFNNDDSDNYYTKGGEYEKGSKYDWGFLRQNIMKHGVKNSLCIAVMPTASTAQILGNNESIEPYMNNIYSRRTMAGNFTIINKHFMKDLMASGKWSENLKQELIYRDGSVQSLDIPTEIKELYKTVWEIKQKDLIDMSADRAPFICQTQSFNVFLPKPIRTTQVSSMHMYGWKKGLKTGMYYLRSQAEKSIQITVDTDLIKQFKETHIKDIKDIKDINENDENNELNENELKRKEFKEKLKKAKEASEEGGSCEMCSG